MKRCDVDIFRLRGTNELLQINNNSQRKTNCIFFVILQNHLQGPRTNYDVAMLQFEQLLANKNFLLTFIDTLESQKSFNIRDK